ncbi:hypothetical protein F5884DRAFT_862648 [Xylogone sp. PMI_703]|nr:hypothetical protein F5884DRAFT_862648 [Xylogone sp. PMI_703]
MPESGTGNLSAECAPNVKTIEDSSSTLIFNNDKVTKRKRSISSDPITCHSETPSLEQNSDHIFPEKPTEECSKRPKLRSVPGNTTTLCQNSTSQEDSGTSIACESSLIPNLNVIRNRWYGCLTDCVGRLTKLEMKKLSLTKCYSVRLSGLGHAYQ